MCAIKIWQSCAFLVLLLKMVTKELARAGRHGCVCSPARAQDSGGTAVPSPSSPLRILGKGISHLRARAGLRSPLLSPRKQLGAAAAQNQPDFGTRLFWWGLAASETLQGLQGWESSLAHMCPALSRLWAFRG